MSSHKKQNYTACKKLLQIHTPQTPPFEPVSIWTTLLPARLTESFIQLLKSVPGEDISLTHARRFINESPKTPELDVNGQPIVFLRALVCSESFMPRPQVEKLLEPLIQMGREYTIKPKKRKIDASNDKFSPKPTETTSIPYPLAYNLNVELRTTVKYYPSTKEDCQEWVAKTKWPILWRGNPTFVPVIMTEPHQKQALHYIDQARRSSNPVCIIVDPSKDQILAKEGASDHLLGHEVMNAVAEIARAQREVKASNREKLDKDPNAEVQEEAYICRSYHVYMTREPCAMCSMALNHSRIERLVYWQSSGCGGCGHGIEDLSIHEREGLNWKYEVWKYVGEETGSD